MVARCKVFCGDIILSPAAATTVRAASQRWRGGE